MAYDDGYGGRPYAGPGAPRSGPRGYGGGPPPPQQYHPAQQHHEGYNDGYGYENYNDNGGYGQDYGGQYQDPYAQEPPPSQRHHSDYYDYPPTRGNNSGRGGHDGGPMPGRPPPNGYHHEGPPPRGGPTPRPRGGGRQYTATSEPGGGHRHDMHDSPMSPRGPGFPGGYGRDDQQMADQMSGMSLNGRRSEGRASAENQRYHGQYGQPPMEGGQGQYQTDMSPHRYSDPRHGPAGRDRGDYNGYEDGYGPHGGQNEFGGPARSMTMPLRHFPDNVPARPSTAADYRTQPGNYPLNTRGPPNSQYGGDYDNSRANYDQQNTASYDHGYENGGNYGDHRGAQQDYSAYNAQQRASMPDFENIQPSTGRGSFEQIMRPGHEQPRPGPEQPQPGAHQTAKLSHAKSQPDLRQPQTAIFEMAGDIPSVPPVPVVPKLTTPAPSHDSGYGGPPQPGIVRAPTAPQPGITRAPTAPPPNTNPDGLPSHPTPVRPGLMANSVVNLNRKPAPVRNYGGMPQGLPPQQQQRMPMQQPPPQQVPQQVPPQPRPNPAPKPQDPPVTPQELEHLRMVIKSNPNDQESALRLARRLIEAATVLIQNIPDAKSRGRARERYVMDAHKILKKLSNAQNSEAMFLMADSLGKGLFGGDDTKEAFTLYQSAAKLGHAGAAYRTAVCCEIGHEEGGGTRKDPMKAIQWYKRAATLGDPPAMYKVGMILLKGLLGQPRNVREAISWLKRASERADTENPHALHELGLLFESAQPNDVIIRDERYAYSLFQQAADLGYKFSQYRLGSAYEFGLLGLPVDARMSITYYSRAAAQEEHQSELALSGWYLTGSDGILKQSDSEAYLWARKAAIAGLAKAEYAMGYFTEVGIGVPANLEDAKRWYWRAAAQDFPKARERLEDLKRAGKHAPARQRERISRSGIERQQEGDCKVM